MRPGEKDTTPTGRRDTAVAAESCRCSRNCGRAHGARTYRRISTMRSPADRLRMASPAPSLGSRIAVAPIGSGSPVPCLTSMIRLPSYRVSSRLASSGTRCSPAVRGGPGQIRPSSSIAHASSARNGRPFARSDPAVVDFPDPLTPSTRSEVPAGSMTAAPCSGSSPTSGRINGRTDRMNAAAASSSSIGPIATSMIPSRGSTVYSAYSSHPIRKPISGPPALRPGRSAGYPFQRKTALAAFPASGQSPGRSTTLTPKPHAEVRC